MRLNLYHGVLLAAPAVFFASSAMAEMDADTCAALAAFAYPDLRIEKVDFLADASVDKIALPPHCQVVGYLEERTGTDNKPYATGFELRLPTNWNGRLYFQGGGGTDGSIRPAVGVNTIGHKPALLLGFATVSTDGGHNLGSRSDTTFGHEDKARVDWGYNSIDIVASAAKAILHQGYGTYPAFSYFVGSSNGGRQGLISALKHPNQFDGILASNPIRQQTRGHVASAWSVTTLTAESPKDAAGKPIFTEFFNQDDLDLLTGEITRQCDPLDGKEDGVVDSARLCSVDFSRLVCSAGANSGCLRQEQVDAYLKIHAGPVNAKGDALYAPFALDAGTDFMPAHIGDATEFPNNGSKARNSSIHNVFREPPTADFDIYAFDFENDPALMTAAAEFTDVTSPDLDAFKGSGAKLMVFHGMADSTVSAIDTTRWFDTVIERYGKDETNGFARLYLLTGVTHDRNGIGPHIYPGLDALMAWVESDMAPEGIRVTGGIPDRERPLCAYPMFVSFDRASNKWLCQ